MSYQKPEKDFGTGPVGPKTGPLLPSQLNGTSIESAQDSHHLDIQEGQISGESVLGAYRQGEDQGSSSEGTSSPPNEDIEDQYAEDTLW